MTARPALGWLLAFGLVLSALSPLATAANAGVTVTSFEYTGDGAVATPEQPRYLWQSASHAFDVGLDGNRSGPVDVCLKTRPPDANRSRDLACQGATLAAGEGTTVTVSLDRWPADLLGRQDVSVVVTDPNASEATPLARATFPVVVLEKGGDPDGDGLTNAGEAAAGTGFFEADTDADGLSDGLEVGTYSTDPNKADTDGDGLTDGTEVHDLQTDPRSADTDGDGLTDDLEVREDGTNPNKADTDGDGLDDAAEVNTYGTNPNKADTDGDGLGDATEVDTYGTNPNRADTDDDGLQDGPEVNVHGTDPKKADTDGDGLDDAAELDRYQTDPTRADSDGDGLDDGAEVDTYGTNPNKADTDGDGRSDGEEVSAGTDPTHPDTPAPGTWPAPSTWVVVLGLVLLAGVAILAAFAFARQSGRPAVVGRLRRLGAALGRHESDADDGASGDAEPTTEPPPIPTNRGRVLELLQEHGGRMLQSDIVEQTDWSKSKVSRVLSDMDEAGEVAKIDVGRGNLIALPEVAPPGARPRSKREEE